MSNVISPYVYPGLHLSRLEPEIFADILIETMLEVFGVQEKQFYGKSKTNTKVNYARQFFYYFMHYRYPSLTLNQIGNISDLQRDHTTVLYGINKIKGFIKIDDRMTQMLLEEIKTKLVIKRGTI